MKCWCSKEATYGLCDLHVKAVEGDLERLMNERDEANRSLAAAEAQAERLAGACQGLLEQVRHDNESEATHHAVADGFDASEFGAYMPSAWHKGHAALAAAEGD